MSTTAAFVTPAVVFLVIVAPLWLILHYWTQARLRKGLSAEDRDLLRQSQQTIVRLEKRLETLETILDAEHEGWRTYENRDSDDKHMRGH